MLLIEQLGDACRIVTAEWEPGGMDVADPEDRVDRSRAG